MIRSFADRDTGILWRRKFSRKFQKVEKAARIKLALLDAATSLGDLSLPGLRLEKLTGDRIGQHSIRVNDQYRICFRWNEGDAHEVEIADYH